MFMYKFHNRLLPSTFNDLLTPVHQIHSYNTRLSAKHSYSLPKTTTNHGTFNILGTKVQTYGTSSMNLVKKCRFLNLNKKSKPILFIITNFSGLNKLALCLLFPLLFFVLAFYVIKTCSSPN